ncbi:hypothetical protein AB1286_30915 [Trinickia sp. NRRL B-1857]|uniref:hypothetical protein n=1 Tax=Trinickia sp. NRRL B-1857 TaxID=3162879 RepID=UPI003D2D1826
MPLLFLLILPAAFAGRFAGVRFGFWAGLAAVVVTLAGEMAAIVVIGNAFGKRREGQSALNERRPEPGGRARPVNVVTVPVRDREAEAVALKSGSITLIPADSVRGLDRPTRNKLIRKLYASLKDAFERQVQIEVQQSVTPGEGASEESELQFIAVRSPDGSRAGFTLGSEGFSFAGHALKAIELWSLAPAKGGGGFSASLYFIDKDALQGSFNEKWSLIGPRLVSFDFDVDYSEEAAAAIAIAVEHIAAMTGAKFEIHEGVDV